MVADDAPPQSTRRMPKIFGLSGLRFGATSNVSSNNGMSEVPRRASTGEDETEFGDGSSMRS
jgi:hypothetical protein